MKCKSWSNKINNFVVRRLKSIKSNGPQHQPQQQQPATSSSSNCATSPQPPLLSSTSSASSSTSSLSSSTSSPQQQQQQQQQYLSNCCSNNMPAMPQEKATAVSLTENNFSELKLKEMTTSAACVAASAASAAAAMATTATAPVSTPTPAMCRQQNHRQQQRNLCGCANASAPEVTMRNKFMTNGHSSPLTAAMATQNSSPSSSPQRLSTASIASSGSNSSTTCCRLRYQQQQQLQQQQQQQQQPQTNGIGSLPTDTAPLASSQTSTSSSVGSYASSSMSSNASASLYPASASQPATTAITPPKKSPKDFIFGKYIGEGSFSVVYLAVDVNTKREFGIKVCEKRQILRERKQDYIRREREVMHMMTNVPGFVNLSCTFQDTRSLYFVMTYAKNGDLLPYINKVGSFDIDSTRHYAAELVLACEQMHRRNIIHRDLKPENILLDEDLHTLIADFGSVKILTAEERAQANEFLLSGGCDMTVERKERSTTGSSSMGSDEERELAERVQAEREQAEREQAERAANGEENEEDYESTGSSNSCGDAEGAETDSPRTIHEQSRFQRQRRSSFVGTAQYVSPEVLQNETITTASDLWALGCIIYQMMSGLPPFRGQFEYTIFREIVTRKFSFPKGFDKDAKDLVSKLIQLNPAERLGALDMNGRYESIRAHPFFKNVDFDTVRQTTPPPISPFLPDLITEKEEFTICENLEPGLDEKQLTRLLGMELGCISDDDNDRKKTAKPKPAITTTPAPLATPNNLQKSAKNSFDFTYLEKHKRLEMQRDDKWSSFADGEVILKKGLVNKRKGLFARKRMLLLTTGPRLIYIDPVHLVKKGEIPWSAELRPEAKNFKIFFVHTPNRTYYLDDPEGYGLEWVAAIEKLHQAVYKEQNHTSNHNSNSNNAQQSTSSTATSASSCSSTSSANSNRLAALALTNNNNNNNNNHSHSTSSVTKTSSAISSSSIAHKTSSLLATPFSMMKTASN